MNYFAIIFSISDNVSSSKNDISKNIRWKQVTCQSRSPNPSRKRI